jgi:hypothetical protein
MLKTRRPALLWAAALLLSGCAMPLGDNYEVPAPKSESESESESGTAGTDNAAPPSLVTQSFGSDAGTPDSARKLMMDRKDDTAITAAAPLAIALPDGLETVPAGFTLTAGATSPAAVVINGNGRTLGLQTGSPGSIISIGDGVTLTLRNISLRGLAANTAPLVTVARGGTLILGDGAVIKDNTSSIDGGGAAVEDGGTLVLDGGTIMGNTAAWSGGGVAVSGQFTMESGTIAGNTAKDGIGVAGGGGVYVKSGGNFTMKSGTIAENRAQVQGGGILVKDAGAISISNAVIRNNTAGTGGGVAGTRTNIDMQNSSIRDNVAPWGGGVYFDGGTHNFSMNGGEILGNTTTPPTPGASGGVHLLNTTTFTMAGAALIHQDNPVYFGSPSVRLKVADTLTQNPAANIVGSVYSGNMILIGSVSGNQNKFLVNGASGKIDASGVYNNP